MNRNWLLIAVLVMIATCFSSAFGDEAEADKELISRAEPDVLSTEMSGVDSLGVMPSEVVTKSGSGTRRVKLETTVFRRHAPISYRASGRRDPFRALIVNEKKEGEIKTDLLRMEKAVLTGIVWSSGDYIAMVRDKDNRSFFLRKGDKIYHGRVVEIEQSRVVFEVTEFGDYQRIVLEVQG